MKSFLYSVANAYKSKYADLSDICFIFPNKRSGGFFLKHLSALSPTPTIAPQVITITDFIERLSGRYVDSRLDLLFRLYECYRKLSASGKENEEDADFDRFRQWGEAVLSDFNEIDMHLVKVDELLKNVADYKEISSTFLTDEQRRVMHEYFGYNGFETKPDRFWRDFQNEGKDEKELSGIKSRFKYLWQVMGPLYHALHENLEADSLTTPGGAYRLAYERVYDLVRGSTLTIEECKPLNKYKKLVFVGFNALSRSEHRIMSLLKREKSRLPGYENEDYADFFWDASGPLLNDASNPAAHFVESNRKYLPSPKWAIPYLEQSEVKQLPEVLHVDSAPSNSAQVKIIGSRLGALLDQIYADSGESSKPLPEGKSEEERKKEFIEKYLRRAKVAIVLPDEGLLQPLLYSLPEIIDNPNLTMGYPLKQTAVVSYMTLLRKLQTHQRRTSDGKIGFFYDDLRLLLAHPFCQTMFGSKEIGALNTELARQHVFAVTPDHVCNLGALAESLLTPLSKDATPEQVIAYMMNALRVADNALKTKGGALIKGKLERQHIATYADALRVVASALKRYDVKMHFSTLFFIVERMVASESVSFEGEPLEGLQVMGLLETRLLDFDYIFIPSMNDKVMPRKARSRTFIPNVMRYAYGMPPAGYQENIFAYYFFRLISRGKGVWMMYDSRTGDGGGGMSRYLLQLRHIMAPESVSFTDFSFIPSSQPGRDDVVEKKEYIKEKLDEFFDPDSRANMSASVLNKYISCPMRFFYERVLGLRTDSEPSESIDAATTGNIVHAALMHIYLPEDKHRKFLSSPVEITSDFIRAALADKERIARIVHRRINKEHFNLPDERLDEPLSGSAVFTFDGLVELVRSVLEYDLRVAPFRLYGCEISSKVSYPLSSGKKVNMKFSIDRLDRLGTDPNAPFRIVDYKTGKVKITAESIDDLFGPEAEAANANQLFLYANLLEEFLKLDSVKNANALKILSQGVLPEIYPVAKILSSREVGKKSNQYPYIAKGYVKNHNDINPDYKRCLDRTLCEVFDENIPFRRTSELSNCRYCPLVNLCGR